MAAGSWIRLTGTSFGTAAMVAGAELGVANGLGILGWDRVGPSSGDSWRDLLTWVTFVFAAAVLSGAAASARNTRALGTRRVAGVTARIMASLCAALGAAIAFPLVWVPARGLPAMSGVNAELAITTTAAAGIAMGFLLALGALSSAPIGVSVAATTAWVWLFALTSVAVSLTRGPGPTTPHLGMVDAPDVLSPEKWWFGPYVMIVIAAAFGVVIAAAGRWLGSHRLGIALSGLAGPALTASAYLVAGPGTPSGDGTRMKLYVASLVAATVGLLASTAIAATHRPPSPAAAASPAALEAARTPMAIAAAPARAPRALAATPHSPEIPEQQERVLLEPGSEEERTLRRSEREHINWMQNLVNTPADPELNARRH